MPPGPRLSRAASAVASLAVVVAGLVVPGSAQASGTPAITLTITPTSVASGSPVELKASMPVRDDTGSVTQEIVQTIDPTKVKLTASSDIVAPAGWTVSYSTDGTNFTATPPASAAAWAAVRAVKATGTVSSLGSDGGKQVAQSTVSGGSVAQTPTTLPSSGLGLDGFKVFFDPGRTRVFNLYHHTSGAILDCYVVLSGARCAGFPFNYGGQTAEAALGVIVGTTAWIGGVSGLYCVDMAAVIANTGNVAGGGSPAKCFSGGSSALLSLKASTWFVWFTGASVLGQSSETKIYALDSTSTPATVYCIDTALRAACSTPTINTGITGTGPQAGGLDGSNIYQWGDLLYVSIANGNVDPLTERVTCVRISTGARCTGWSTDDTYSTPQSQGRKEGKFVPIPTAGSGVQAVCYYRVALSHKCWEADGTQRLASYYNFPNFNTANSGGTYAYGVPTQIGSRVYYGNALWGDPTPNFAKAEVICFDASAFSGAGGRCNDASSNLTSATTKNYVNYTVTPDPVIPNCLWVTQHANPVFKTVNILTGELGCSAIAPQRTVFSGATSVPRMGCSATGAITSWKSFTLDTPVTGFTSAKLTVRNSSGADIPGWTGLSLTAGTLLDLSSLPVGTSGQTPSFVVDFMGLAGAATSSARISAIGDSPQLCLSPTTIPPCPAASVRVSAGSLFATTTSPVASGSTTPGGALQDDSATFTIQAPAVSQCGSTLTGRATTGAGGSGTGVSGVTVSLVDDSGNALLDDSGITITASTDDSGNYSLGYLRPGNYKVRFPSTSSLSSVNAQTASGGAGSVLTAQNAVSGVSTSGTSVLLVGTNGVVNGQYIVQPVARPNTSTGGQGVLQTISPLADDSASSGATYSGVAAPLKLCGSGQVYPNCTATSLSISGQGTYSVSGANVTFSPCSANGIPSGAGCTGAFTGTATTVSYQSTDSLGRTATSTITPFVVAKPTATADTSTGAMSTAQVINVRANDSAGSGATLVTSSIELCLAGAADSTCDSNNAKFWAQSGQGVYTVDDTTGMVTFTPCGSAAGNLVVGGVSYATSCTGVPFTGTATAIKYIVKDTIGQIASANITPAVTPPATVTPTADTSAGGQGAVQSVTPLANDTLPAGVTASASTVRLCGTSETAPNCTGTYRILYGQGVYTLNAGVIKFTPCNGVTGTLIADGAAYAVSCTATPFTGTAPAVTYIAKDNLNRTFSTTYTPSVYGKPTAVANTSSGSFNTPQAISPLANDTAAAGATLVTASTRLCGPGDDTTVTGGCDDTTLTIANQGTYVLNTSTGVVTFTPLATFTGAATPIRYQIVDSVGQSTTATITPTVGSPPASTANADTSTAGQGVAQVVNLLTNDATPVGVTLTASSVRLCGPPAYTCDDTTVTIGGVGTYTLSGGTVTFTPLPGYTGAPTALGYQVTDTLGRNVSSTYTPTVVPRPNAVDDTSTGAYTLPQTIDVLGDDTAGAATSLVASSVRLCGPGDDSTTTSTGSASRCDDTTLMTASGTFTVNASGSVTFSPCTANGVPNPSCTGAFSGTAPAVAYQVADALGQLDAATIVVSVAAPVAPSAADDTVTARPGASAAFASITATGGLATPGDGSLVPASTCLVDPSSGATPAACDSDDTVTIAGVGTWQLNRTTGVVTFTADPSATSGVKTAVSYRVTDTNGQTATGRLVPVIPPLPVAVDDSSYGEQGQSQVILPSGNDVPGDPAAPMSAASVRLCDPSVPQSVPNCTATSVSVTGQGTYSVNPANGQVTFTPVDDTFYGVVTPVGYQIADATGQIAGAQIRPQVLPRPAPRAVDDSGSAAYGQTVTFSPLTNDSAGTLPSDGSVTPPVDLNNASLRLCGTGDAPPTCDDTTVVTVDGTYVLSGTSVTFTPAAGFSGTATAPLQYQVANSYTQSVGGVPTAKAQTSSAYLIPTIAAPTPPAAVDDTKVGVVNTTVALAPIANDTSGQVAPLLPASLRMCDTPSQSPSPLPGTCTATSLSVPGKGTLTLNPSTGQVEFAPLTDWTGTLTRPYVIADGAGNVVTANVNVVINAPTAVNDDTYGLPGAVQTLSLLSNDSPAAGTATTLNASSVRLCASGETVPSCTATSVTTAKGTYTVSSGVVTFTPVAGFTDGDDSVAYVVRDSVGQVASAIARPYVVGPPNPSAADDSGYAPLGEPVTFRPWVNDDTMGNKTVGSITYTDTGFTRSSVRLCGPGDAAGSCDDTTLTTADGSYAVNPATGVVTFTPAAGFTGTAAYPVTYEMGNSYTVNAGSGSGSQVVSATLTPVIVAPPAPSAADDTGNAGYGQPVAFTPWSNDTPMGDATTGSVFYDDSGFTPTSVRLCGAGDVVPTCDDTTVSTADGTYVVNPATGVVTFAPAVGFSGEATAVRYQITDPFTATNSGAPAGSGSQVSSALLKPTIGPLTMPTANADAGSGYTDDTVAVNLPGNDAGGTYSLDLTSVMLCDDTDVAPACTHTTAVLPGQGTLVVNPATGQVVFTPVSGWDGVVSVPYSIADTHGNTVSSSVTITIIAPVLPVADNDAATTSVDTPVTLDAGSDDVDGTYPLDMASVRICGADDTAPACTKLTLTITQGTFTVNQSTGKVTFTPATGWYGTVTVPYSVADTRGNRDDALLSVTIPAPAPGGGGGGGAPAPGGGGGGTPPPVTPPVTDNDMGVVRPGSPAVIDPIANDTPGGSAYREETVRLCPDGAVPPECAGTQVAVPQGTWEVDPVSGQVTFTPEEGFHGKVEIPYQVTTEDGTVVDAVITVWIVDPPQAADDASSGRVDQAQTLDPWVNDAPDAAAPWDRSSLRLCGAGQSPPNCDQSRVETPDGVYAVDPVTGKVVFTPAPGFTGDATPLQYQVADAAGQVASAWLRPTVRGGGGGGGATTGTLIVSKSVTAGDGLRTGAVKLVAVCSNQATTLRRTFLLPVGTAKQTWRVKVPAGMDCTVTEKAAGAPDEVEVQPTRDGQRWGSGTVPRLAPGQTATVGTAVPIERLELSAKGGCAITASRLQATTAGTCVITWRVPDGVVSTTTKWAYSTPVAGSRTSKGTVTRSVPITAGQVTRISFLNTYTAASKVVTRTVAVTSTCPVTKARPTQGGDPGTCSTPKAGVSSAFSGRYTHLMLHSIIIP